MKKKLAEFIISFIVVLLTFISFEAYSSTIITISPYNPNDYFFKGNMLAAFEDESKIITIEDILSNPTKFEFKTGEAESYVSLNNPNSNYWIRFQIYNPTNKSTDWVLENIDPHISNFELYIQTKDGKVEKKKAGYSIPFNEKDYQHKNLTFEIPLLAKDTVTYYIKANSKFKNKIILKARWPVYFTTYVMNEYYLLGIFYGVLAIMLIYNLIIFFAVKERIYLYYVFYVLSAAVITFTEDGLGFQYLWPELPFINYYLSIYSPLLFLFTFTLYSQQFLKLKQISPILNKTLIAINIGYFCYFLLNTYFFNIDWNPVLFLIPFSLVYIGAIISFKRGNRAARFFILAYSFVITSLLLLILRMAGITHGGSGINIYAFNISLILEIVIFSYALADRIRLIKEQEKLSQLKIIEQLKINENLNEEIKRGLETKVKERTQALEFANEQLKLQAEEIRHMNLLLKSENIELEDNVKELTKARVMMKGVDFEEFRKIFPTKESCLNYLHDLKWKNEFTCKKCSNDKYSTGKDQYSKRCTKCGYNESATAYTIFHKCKFDITKAFYILFLIYENKEKISSPELAEILDLGQSTCWNFTHKIYELKKARKKSGRDDEPDDWSSLILEQNS
jgi:hypothetical protein